MRLTNRLNENEAFELLKNTDLLALAREADAVRQRYHPDDPVTFVIDRNINYTNICTTKCKFCAFYRDIEDKDAYLLSRDEIFNKISEAIELGGTQIMLQGGLHPDLGLDYYVDLLADIKSNFQVHIHSFSPPEIVHISKTSELSIDDSITALKEAGLDSLPGGGAEILVDEIRHQISPKKITSSAWLDVMRAAHKQGLKTSATMMFGCAETIADRIAHMKKIRDLQDETGGFTAFIPWTFQPGHTELGGMSVNSIDYLRTLAVARIFLDNIPNIQASWVTQGSQIGQLALFFGANDMGSIMIEENVVKAAGVSYNVSKEEMVKLISDAGFVPAQRSTLYDIIEVYANAIPSPQS